MASNITVPWRQVARETDPTLYELTRPWCDLPRGTLLRPASAGASGHYDGERDVVELETRRVAIVDGPLAGHTVIARLVRPRAGGRARVEHEVA